VVAKASDIQPTIESLKGKRVGVLQGTTQETYGNEHWAPKGLKLSLIRARKISTLT
jgi:histidine transport system substrate-binding protein